MPGALVEAGLFKLARQKHPANARTVKAGGAQNRHKSLAATFLGAKNKSDRRRPPPADPRAPAVKPQWLQPPFRYQFVHLRASRAGFARRADVIVDHHPAAVGKPVAVAIDVAPHVGVGVENEETDFAGSQARFHIRDNVLIEGRTVQQRHSVRQTGAGDMLCQVLENIPGGELVILERATWLDADEPFFAHGSARPKACRDRRRAAERADLKNAAV